MEKLCCPGCGSIDLVIFSNELYRCTYCGSLLFDRENSYTQQQRISELTQDFKPHKIQQKGRVVSGSRQTQDTSWRERYEHRKLQNAGQLTHFVVDENGMLVDYDGIDVHINIPKGVKSIGMYTFHSLVNNLLTVNIPDGVTTIGPMAFYRCEKLEKVTLPKSVDFIDRSAFSHCVFEDFVVPNKVTCLREGVFERCENLKNLILPNGIKSIEQEALRDTALSDIHIPSLEHIGNYAFAGCNNFKELYIPKNVLYVGEGAFADWEEDQTLYIYAETAYWDIRWNYRCKAKIIKI